MQSRVNVIATRIRKAKRVVIASMAILIRLRVKNVIVMVGVKIVRRQVFA
jgi:hypothetical protein